MLKFPCRYHPMGCKEAHTLSAKAEHERNCPFLQLKCPCPRSPHQVSQLGFLLLEEVEGAFGTAEQIIERVQIADFDETWLTALNSRVS